MNKGSDAGERPSDLEIAIACLEQAVEDADEALTNNGLAYIPNQFARTLLEHIRALTKVEDTE